MGQFDSGDDWLRRSLKACPNDLMRQIVEDNRGGPPTYSSPIATPRAKGQQSEEQGNGWREATPLRPPEGLQHIDAMCDEEDRRFRAQRVKEAVEANLVQRALQPAAPQEQEPKARG